MTRELPSHVRYAVVIPYSSNVDFQKGKPHFRLSTYSQFVTEAARSLVRQDIADKILLCGEDIFGRKYPVTTTSLMQTALTHGTDALDPLQVETVGERGLNSTPLQIRALSQFKRRNHLRDEDLLLVDLAFHDRRIQQYMKGYQLSSPTLPAEQITPTPPPPIPKEYLRREQKLRLLSFIDPKGYIPIVLTFLRGGFSQDSVIMDITPGGRLEKIRGSEKLRRLAG